VIRLDERATPRTIARRWSAVLKRIAGMPDYKAYVEHLRERHPACAIPTEKEYFELYLDGRYRGGGGRCC